MAMLDTGLSKWHCCMTSFSEDVLFEGVYSIFHCKIKAVYRAMGQHYRHAWIDLLWVDTRELLLKDEFITVLSWLPCKMSLYCKFYDLVPSYSFSVHFVDTNCNWYLSDWLPSCWMERKTLSITVCFIAKWL